MTPQDEFEAWYRRAIGITVEEARRQGVSDLKMLREAFLAGLEVGRGNDKREVKK